MRSILLVTIILIAIGHSTGCTDDDTGNAANQATANDEALLTASGMGDIPRINELLAGGADVNAVGENGMTSLHYAASGLLGLKAVAVLTDAGANVNHRDDAGRTPLIVILQTFDDRHVQGAVHTAVAALVEKKADLAVVTPDGRTPLMMAVGSQMDQVASTLLAANADVHATDHDGWTAMHYAASNGEPAIIETLRAEGADMAVVAKDNWTPLLLALNNGHFAVADQLLDAGASAPSLTDLHWAVIREEPDQLESLLKQKKLINTPDRIGRTPLLWAARLGNTQAAGELLKAGADVRHADHRRLTALHAAMMVDAPDLVPLLLDAGAEVSARTVEGMTPLHYAADFNQPQQVTRLLKAGADLHARDGQGSVPLHYAAAHADGLIVGALLDAGADPLVCNHGGYQPLDWIESMLPTATKQILQQATDRAIEMHDAKVLAQVDAAGAGPDRTVKPTSPENAVSIFAAARNFTDFEMLRTVVRGSEHEMSALEESFAFGDAARTFRKSLIEAYGPDAWSQFNDIDHARFQLGVIDEDQLRHMIVQKSEDSATIVLSGVPRQMVLTLARDDENWFIEAKCMIFPEIDPQATANGMRRMTGILKKLRNKIGEPGVTPETLDQEMARRMFGQ